MDLPQIPRTDMKHPSFCYPLRASPIDRNGRIRSGKSSKLLALLEALQLP